ncbi:unnamed protein product [Polarella glacialis]|uniref:EF-hand domain-containing protein n=1 Tax=Polarella glacialis TaxID=89957 RepID=A0A813J8C8_POLGL|nr:unnamed protein product [Polarella glacialis]
MGTNPKVPPPEWLAARAAAGKPDPPPFPPSLIRWAPPTASPTNQDRQNGLHPNAVTENPADEALRHGGNSRTAAPVSNGKPFSRRLNSPPGFPTYLPQSEDSNPAYSCQKEMNPHHSQVQETVMSKPVEEKRVPTKGSHGLMKADIDDLVKERTKNEDEEARLHDAQDEAMNKARGMGYKAVNVHKVMKINIDDLPLHKQKLHDLQSWWGFDSFIGLVILVNGAVIGVETQFKASLPLGCDDQCVCSDPMVSCTPKPLWIGVLDYVFFAIYFVELALRFYTYGCPVLRSHWVKFDTFLVSSALCDIILTNLAIQNAIMNQLMLVRMLRLARLARAVRLMVQFQTLWALVQGLMHSINTLLWTFLLVMILIYIFAVIGMEFITVDADLPLDHPYNIAAADNFGDIGDAIMTLLQCFSFDSIGGIYRPLIRQRALLFFYFMSVLLLLSVALMNLVTALMVNSAFEQGNQDKETQKLLAGEKKKKQMIELKILFEALDEDGSGELTMEEINDGPEAVREQLIEIAGTDDIQALFDMLDYDGGGTVETDEFCEGVIKALSSDKPMELGRLVKQCSDILKNSRETVSILKGEPPGGGSSSEDDGGKPGDKGPGRRARVETLEARVGGMEQTISQIQGDVGLLVEALMKKVGPLRGSSNPKMGQSLQKGSFKSQARPSTSPASA